MNTRPIFKVRDHDYTAFVAFDGLSPTRNDLDADGAGRDTTDGCMVRSLIGDKWKWTTKFNRLPAVIMRSLATDLKGEFVPITFLCPEENRHIERTFYNATLTCGQQKYLEGQGTFYDNCTVDVTEQ